MAEQSGRAELERVIEKVSGHIGRLMSRWPMVETAIEQSVWTIRSHGFDRQYPEKNEDKLSYIKVFLKQGFVPWELSDRWLRLLSVTKGVLKTRNIIAHSYISGVDGRTTDVLFTRVWITKTDADRAFGTKIEKRKIGELRKHAKQCIELSFELPCLASALREQLGKSSQSN